MAEGTQSIRIPPKGTRGRSVAIEHVLMRIFKPLMDRMQERYRNVPGAEQPTFNGFPIVLLTTIGARSGKERTHVLGGFPEGPNTWLLVASNGGSAAHPQWFINLARNPHQVWVQAGNRRFRANVESLQGKERDDAYARVVKVAKNYGAYPTKTDREIPVLRVTPAE